MSFFEKSPLSPSNHILNVIIFTAILFAYFNLLSPEISLSEAFGENKPECPCVVYRLDDIQDNFLNQSQLAVMNLFLEKNQSLTLALIPNALGNDSTVLNKIHMGEQTGNFELAIHGWNHENFSKLNEQNQVELLLKASKKMHTLFGINPTIFIPPSYEFNNLTLDASRQEGIKIISSLDKFYEHINQTNLITSGTHSDPLHRESILHLPTTLQYSYFDGKQWNTYSEEQSLQIVHESIKSYGYAVVTLHPQGFANLIEGNLTNSVNATQINNLAKLINSINSESIHTTSFHKLAGIIIKQVGEPDKIASNTTHHMILSQ